MSNVFQCDHTSNRLHPSGPIFTAAGLGMILLVPPVAGAQTSPSEEGSAEQPSLQRPQSDGRLTGEPRQPRSIYEETLPGTPVGPGPKPSASLETRVRGDRPISRQ